MSIVGVSGGVHLDRVIADAGSIASILYVTFVGRSYKRESKTRQEQDRQLSDVIKGVLASPGVEARPSLVERLGNVESSYGKLDKKTDAQSATLEKILNQLVDTSTLVARIDELTALVTKLSTSFIEHLQHPAGPIPRTPRARMRPPLGDPNDKI